MRDGVVEEFVDLIGTVYLDIHSEDHNNQDCKNDGSVDVISHEFCLQSSSCSVYNNTPWNEERRKFVVNAGEGFDGSGATKQQHGGHNDVSAECEEEEGLVCGASPSCVHDLAQRVSRRGDLLEGDRNHTEKNDLDGGPRCIPVSRSLEGG